MKKFILTLIISSVLISLTVAQTAISLSSSIYIKKSDTVAVPITVKNFSDVGAISLAIKYDTAAVHFSSIKKTFTQGVFETSDSDNGEIKISWFDLSPLKLTNDTLMNIVFINPSDNSNIQFDTALCEIADTSASVIKTVYNNGSITQKIMPVTLAGKVWYDENRNGLIDSGEIGVQWVTVNLFKSDGTWLTWQFSDSLGYYDFKNYKLNDTTEAQDLQPGGYYVSFYLVDDNKIYSFSSLGAGNNQQINSHAKITSDTTAETNDIILSSGENFQFANAGLVLKNATAVSGSKTDLSGNSIPTDFSLKQNYPNPFNPTTTIQFGVPKTENLNLTVYNILGQRIAVLIDGEISAGMHTVTFNASNFNSGVYIYHLSGQGVNLTQKMILTK